MLDGMTGTLITVAPTGAEHAKADLPQLPTTLEELTDTARRCEAAGASVIHLHLRDAEPDSCSLTCGTVNFGDDIFLNPMPFMRDLYRRAQEREIVPEFEIFEVGQLWALERLIDEFGLPFGGSVHVDLVLGVPGALPGTMAALMAGVAALPNAVTSWSATGIGRSHLPVMAGALAAGGHVRVGMEDNVVFERGRIVQRNDELVTRAAQLARLLQRPALSTHEARALLGIKRR